MNEKKGGGVNEQKELREHLHPSHSTFHGRPMSETERQLGWVFDDVAKLEGERESER